MNRRIRGGARDLPGGIAARLWRTNRETLDLKSDNLFIASISAVGTVLGVEWGFFWFVASKKVKAFSEILFNCDPLQSFSGRQPLA
ncbi:MAG: hypothetical protein ACRC4P_06845 [Aeromonas sp.]